MRRVGVVGLVRQADATLVEVEHVPVGVARVGVHVDGERAADAGTTLFSEGSDWSVEPETDGFRWTSATGDVAETLARAEADIVSGGFDSVDYVALADADSLERLTEFRKPARLLAAARIGKTRLIDNLAVA